MNGWTRLLFFFAFQAILAAGIWQWFKWAVRFVAWLGWL